MQGIILFATIPKDVPTMRLPLLMCLLIFVLLSPADAQETATAAASMRYARPFITERIFVGKNYRDIWAMPVQARVLRLDTEKGRLRIKRLGGGMQTKSLHLEAGDGRDYVLRSIDKTVERAMDASGIKDKRIRKLSQQMISAAQPYGQLTLPPMARAVGVISTEPELVFVPDDPAFGEHRAAFANTLCLLELREPVLYPSDEANGTKKMRARLAADSNVRLDEAAILQARLLDIVVADWDRHDAQWKWGYHPQPDGRVTIYPIPRDHDQTYFNSTGVLFAIIRTFGARMFVGFRKGLKLQQLNYRSWYFDKTLMPHLTEEDWRQGIRTFQEKLTDSVIEAGLQQMPQEVYAAYGALFAEVLKIRRDKLSKDGLKYYRFLQTHPKQVAKSGKRQLELMEVAEKVKKGDTEGETVDE